MDADTDRNIDTNTYTRTLPVPDQGELQWARPMWTPAGQNYRRDVLDTDVDIDMATATEMDKNTDTDMDIDIDTGTDIDIDSTRT